MRISDFYKGFLLRGGKGWERGGGGGGEGRVALVEEF